MECPVCSFDLSAIEHPWDELGRCLHQRIEDIVDFVTDPYCDFSLVEISSNNTYVLNKNNFYEFILYYFISLQNFKALSFKLMELRIFGPIRTKIYHCVVYQYNKLIGQNVDGVI